MVASAEAITADSEKYVEQLLQLFRRFSLLVNQVRTRLFCLLGQTCPRPQMKQKTQVSVYRLPTKENKLIFSIFLKTEGQAIFLNTFTVFSLSKRKFFVCPFVYEKINGSFPFANVQNGLNGLAHLRPRTPFCQPVEIDMQLIVPLLVAVVRAIKRLVAQ